MLDLHYNKIFKTLPKEKFHEIVTAIDVTNVANWFYQEQEGGMILDEIPCHSPPWQSAWYEWTVPMNWKLMGGQIHTLKDSYNPMAIYCVALPSDLVNWDNQPNLRFTAAASSKWTIACTLYGNHRNKLYELCYKLFFVNEDGSAADIMIVDPKHNPYKDLSIDEMKSELGIEVNSRLCEELDKTGSIFEALKAGYNDMTWPMHVAVGFLHCKNTLIVNPPETSAKLKKKRERKGKLPKIQYKNLVVEPLRQKVKVQGAKPGKGRIRQVLRIIRGHWKDYRQTGLFGKHKGIYWWDNAIVGNKKHGEIHKTYEVKV
jgi:hypothetical protein